MTTSSSFVIARPMTSPAAPEWPGALWVGSVDVREIDRAAAAGVSSATLLDADGYAAARLLVRLGDTVLGFVEVPVDHGRVAVSALVAENADVDRAAAASAEATAPVTATTAVTVVICTRDRADQLRDALTSVLAVDHPSFDVVVVDNASATDATARLIAEEFAGDPRVRLVTEPVPGLSSARNTGVRNATGEIVAFTDDDVVVDPGWLTAVTRAFASAADVECVSGLVPSGELRTPVQRYFDDRVSWSKNLTRRTFRLAEQPADLPMFPFSVGEFGTGANFALRRETVLRLGAFDTAFGAGTPTGGGEDLDIFTRVLFDGGALVIEPSALIWHRHRSDLAALRAQARGYGVGLGAWLTKVALDPRMAKQALRRAPQAFVRLVGKGAGELAEGPDQSTTETAATSSLPTHADLAREVRRVGRLELMSVLLGPVRFLQQRWKGTGVLDQASRTAVSEPGAPVRPCTELVRRPTGWGFVALGAGIVGVTALVPGMPQWWRVPALGALVLVAPGAALRSWVSMRSSTTAVVVPAFGVAVSVLLTAAMAATGAWGTSGAVLVIAAGSALAGLCRRVIAGRSEGRSTAYRARTSRLEQSITRRLAAGTAASAAIAGGERARSGGSSS